MSNARPLHHRPGAGDRRRRRGDEHVEVGTVASQDRVVQLLREHDEMGVHDIGRTCHRKEATHDPAVVERMDLERREEPGQTGLSRAVPPDLGYHRVGGAKRDVPARCCRQERLGGGFTAVDRDEEPSIDDHKP